MESPAPQAAVSAGLPRPPRADQVKATGSRSSSSGRVTRRPARPGGQRPPRPSSAPPPVPAGPHPATGLAALRPPLPCVRVPAPEPAPRPRTCWSPRLAVPWPRHLAAPASQSQQRPCPSGPGKAMVPPPPPPGLPASSLLQVLLLGLSALAPASGAQFQLHVPSGLDQVLAVEGEEVVLPAWYTFQGEAVTARPWETLTLMWFLEQEGEDLKQVLAHINGATTSQDGASLVYPMPSRNVSLRLQRLREKDSGSYRCSVNVQDKQGTSRGHSSKTLKLDVWVPPAPPSCHLLGTPRVGTNVTLSCKSPRSKPAALYQWERSHPSVEVFFAPVLDAISGFLSLRNLSSSMSGVYVCKATNRVGSASCNVTLEVSSGPGAAVVAGAVVGTLVGLGLLAGLVLLYQRQGKAPEEVANDIKEDAAAPRTLPWPKGSDTISKNGTLSSVTSSPALRPPHRPSRLGASTASTPTTPTRSHGWVSPSALSRKGAVPVMVPAQNQAGSLV